MQCESRKITQFLNPWIFALAFLAACTQNSSVNSNRIVVIQPSQGHCQYTIAPANFQTLESYREMRGKVGRVLYSSNNLDRNFDILKTGFGLKPVDTDFVNSGDALMPANLDTLFAASLYFSVEVGYLLAKSIDPAIDLSVVIPNLSDTRIVHHAKRLSNTNNSQKEIFDNAEYLSIARTGLPTLNYFFSYPTQQIKEIPLGLNLGVMNHEFSHLIFQHLFYEPGIKRNLEVGTDKPTLNTLAALDEGLADYFGFLATKDPGYFLCSFPLENRDLSLPKSFSPQVISRIESSSGEYFDSHEGGAVWASIQYEIGQTLGNHQLVGKSLLKLMSNILECPNTVRGNTLNFNFGDLARCHQSILSTNSQAQSVARQIYLKYLGSYGAGL